MVLTRACQEFLYLFDAKTFIVEVHKLFWVAVHHVYFVGILVFQFLLLIVDNWNVAMNINSELLQLFKLNVFFIFFGGLDLLDFLFI